MAAPAQRLRRSKLLGDWFALEDADARYVLRVESLFGEPAPGRGRRRAASAAIVERITAGEEVPVFADRTVSPSYTRGHRPRDARASRAQASRPGCITA